MEKELQKTNFRSKFSSINPSSTHCVLKFLKKCKQFPWTDLQQQTSAIRRQKKLFFHLSFNAEFIELYLNFLKQQEVAKKAKIKVAQKNAYMCDSKAIC